VVVFSRQTITAKPTFNRRLAWSSSVMTSGTINVCYTLYQDTLSTRHSSFHYCCTPRTHGPSQLQTWEWNGSIALYVSALNVPDPVARSSLEFRYFSFLRITHNHRRFCKRCNAIFCHVARMPASTVQPIRLWNFTSILHSTDFPMPTGNAVLVIWTTIYQPRCSAIPERRYGLRWQCVNAERVTWSPRWCLDV